MSNERPDGVRGLLLGFLVVLVTALVVTSPVTAAVATPTTGASRVGTVDRSTPVLPATPNGETEARQATQEIDSCTVITEPGRYELTSDVRSEMTDACIHVRASDVVLDGNNHTIAGNRTNDSVGVLVYRGTPGSSVALNETLSSVTVRDLRVTDWGDGVAVGDIAGTDTEARLEDVVATNNTRAGVRLTEAERGSLLNVTATENRNGLTFWEVSDTTVRNVTASDNDQLGFGLYQNVEDNTFRNVTATGNGPAGYASAGIYLSTDVVDNRIVDAYVANNDGPGIRFSDSFRNVLRDVVVESNANRGLFGARASGESLQNVTVRDNGGPEVEIVGGGLNADGLRIGQVASLSFRDEAIVLEPFDTADLATTPRTRGRPTAGSNSNVADEVTLTFEYEGEGAQARLWRQDGSDWEVVTDVSVDRSASTITGTVSGDGRVLVAQSTVNRSTENGTEDNPANSESEDNPANSGNEGSSANSGNEGSSANSGNEGSSANSDNEDSSADSGTGVSGTDATLVVRSPRGRRLQLRVRRRGLRRTARDRRPLRRQRGHRDRERRRTVTVTGSTGDAAGDAFLVTGEIVEFSIDGVDSGYELTFDGEDVTERLTGSDGQAAGTGVSGTDAPFVVRSPRGRRLQLRVRRRGLRRTARDRRPLRRQRGHRDRERRRTVTVTGSTGDAAGDAFLVSGEIVEFRLTGAGSGYELVFDGEDVTDTLTADGESGSDTVSQTGLLRVRSSPGPTSCSVTSRRR